MFKKFPIFNEPLVQWLFNKSQYVGDPWPILIMPIWTHVYNGIMVLPSCSLPRDNKDCLIAQDNPIITCCLLNLPIAPPPTTSNIIIIISSLAKNKDVWLFCLAILLKWVYGYGMMPSPACLYVYYELPA